METEGVGALRGLGEALLCARRVFIRVLAVSGGRLRVLGGEKSLQPGARVTAQFDAGPRLPSAAL